ERRSRACFFFFQAEDGIRDFHVTGVQTCALPIYETTLLRTYSLQTPGVAVKVVDLAAFLRVDPKKPEADVEGAAKVGDVIYWIRSEERRVGKECRCGRAVECYVKKRTAK